MKKPAYDGRSVDRGFWVLFVGGWTVLGGLMVAMETIENQAPLTGVATIITPTVLATLIALRRRVLLNPKWSLLKTVGTHLGVGIGYALASGLGTTGLLLSFGQSWSSEFTA